MELHAGATLRGSWPLYNSGPISSLLAAFTHNLLGNFLPLHQAY